MHNHKSCMPATTRQPRAYLTVGAGCSGAPATAPVSQWEGKFWPPRSRCRMGIWEGKLWHRNLFSRFHLRKTVVSEVCWMLL